MSCPLCNSSNIDKVITFFEKITEENGSLTSSPEGVKEISILACRTCENAWTNPFPKIIDYCNDDYHERSINAISRKDLRTIDNLPKEWQHSTKMQVQLLSKYLAPNAKILEMGCGEGILLSEFGKRGFQVKGIEPSVTASHRARQKHLDVVSGYFPHKDINDTFDAVILSHVLEHFEEPLHILSEIAKICPQGYLLLIQTNYRGIIPQLRARFWYGWAVKEHYWHFTPKGLTFIASKASLELVTCQFSSLAHSGKREKVLQLIARAAFPLQDQFHLLLKYC